jgi:hypothetical protein
MAQKQNSALAIQIGLAILPSLIQSTENYIGAGSGEQKHQAVLDGVGVVVSNLALGGAAIAAQNNPTLAPLAQPLAAFFSTIIKAIVDGRKLAGAPVTTEPQPNVSGAGSVGTTVSAPTAVPPSAKG